MTSNFLKCYLKSVPALCLSPLSNGKLALSHLVFYPLVLFEPFLLKSIAGLLCMQENIEDSRKGDQCLEQHNILPTSMVRPRLCHQKETAGSLYLPRSVVFRSLFQTPVFANTNFFLSVAVALEILISLSLSPPFSLYKPKSTLMDLKLKHVKYADYIMHSVQILYSVEVGSLDRLQKDIASDSLSLFNVWTIFFCHFQAICFYPDYAIYCVDANIVILIFIIIVSVWTGL